MICETCSDTHILWSVAISIHNRLVSSWVRREYIDYVYVSKLAGKVQRCLTVLQDNVAVRTEITVPYQCFFYWTNHHTFQT